MKDPKSFICGIPEFSEHLDQLERVELHTDNS